MEEVEKVTYALQVFADSSPDATPEDRAMARQAAATLERVERERDEWKTRAHGYEVRLGRLGNDLNTAEAQVEAMRKAAAMFLENAYSGSYEEQRASADSLRAALSAPVEEGKGDMASRDLKPASSALGWRTIDSAPMDGTSVLLWAFVDQHAEGLTLSGKHVFSGYWDNIDGSWCSTTSTWEGPFLTATHWMPLPAPPSSKSPPIGSSLEGEDGQLRDTANPALASSTPESEGVLDLPERAVREAVSWLRFLGVNVDGDLGMSSARNITRAILGAASSTPESSAQADWRDIETDAPPAARGYIKVRTVTTYRWQAYKPDGARQMRKPGRWQAIGDFGGWDNAELPESGQWMPYDPGNPAPAEARGDQPEGEA